MTKSKKKHVIPQQTYLTDDLIIEEILTRLPIKSILQFKSVSKHWCSTLSSSHFANAHLIKSGLSRPSAPVDTLFIHYRNKNYLFSYDDDDDHDDDQVLGNFKDKVVKLDVDFGKKEYLRLTGCCNGLICLTELSNKYFVLWNPATRMLHKYESYGYLKRFDELKRPIVCSGFGYSSAIDDYKYVRIFKEHLGSVNIVHIFSLRENKWREIEFGHDPLLLYRHAVPVNEKLYWAANCSKAGDLVVSFDLGNERFDIIKINWLETEVLGVMGGHLSKCSYRGDKIMHILQPTSVLKSICLPKGLRLDSFSQMVGFTKADKIFVTGSSCDDVGSGSRILGLVDTCTKPMKYTALLRFDMLLNIARYFPSLVSPIPM
ncbi:F-box/kelch-repeat protein At3g23880-like [Silene latifolia]|uniref:F-box/kelch-repeat protein At3g23880-like n=1 Tax=Silene latifolia TaxID=37657 RepID=UPI003D7748C9